MQELNALPLAAQGLTCIRSGRTLFRDLNLRLAQGRVMQVEGENGAGKTSLLRIVCGLTLAQAGMVSWGENDIRRCRPEYHQHLLYIGHSPGIKEELSPLENLHFFRALGGHNEPDPVLEEALDTVGLFGYEDVPVRTLSAGQRRRVGLARLWLSTAPLWILDEPFTAIDKRGIERLEARITHHARRGGQVLLTSHQPLHLDGVTIQRLELQ